MQSPLFETIEAQASYGIGLQIGQQLTESGLQDLLPEAVLAGMNDVLTGNAPQVAINVVHQALHEMHQRAESARRQQQQLLTEQGEIYLQNNRQRPDVQTTESGLQFRVINPGDGAIPSHQDRVRVHYTGKLIDGTVFDSSHNRDVPAEFPVNGVIPGWIEALTMMPAGAHWELTIPHKLAYGERGAGVSIPPFSTLIFEVELLEIV